MGLKPFEITGIVLTALIADNDSYRWYGAARVTMNYEIA
jgi:hypothetical protein